MSQKLAIDVGHGFVKGLNESGERILFPSLIAPAKGIDLGPLSVAHLTTVQWAGQNLMAYWVGEDARLQATSLFGSNKASDPLTRDLTIIAVSRLKSVANSEEITFALGVGVPLAWYGRERAALQKALLGTVHVDDHIFHVSHVSVFPQGVAAILSALPAETPRGLYGLVDVGYRTTDYLVVQVNENGLPTIVPGLAGSLEQGVHNALQEVAGVIEQQWKVSYAPHELANVSTITVRGYEITVAADIRQAYERLGSGLVAKLQTAWAPILPRLRVLYVAGGGVGAMPRNVGGMPTHVVPDFQWANVKGYLSALGPSIN